MSPLLSQRRAPQLDRKDRGRTDHAAKQAEQRERRRKRLDVRYGEHFDLLVEVHDIAAPLADRVTAEPSPLSFRADVLDLADAVHGLVVVVFDLVTTADARRRTADLPQKDRARAVAALCELAERPQPPEPLSDGMISSGLWVAEVLCSHVGPHAGKLSDLLSRALPPGTRRGLLSVSETLVEALRVVDRAALALERHLDRAAFDRKTLRPKPKTVQPDPRAELAALGIDLEGIAP